MLRLGARLTVFVTTVEAQGTRLLLSAQTDNDAWAKIESKLSAVGPEFTGGKKVSSIDEIRTGDVCIAKYEDEAWYRAQVLSTNPQTSTLIVNFIDFGNNENVSVLDIVTTHSSFFDHPPQAQKFVLDEILPSDGEKWSKDELAYLNENLVNTEFGAKITGEGNGVVSSTITLLGNAQESLSQKFVSDGVGRMNEAHIFPTKVCSMSLTVGRSYAVYVTFTHSPINFWIQLASSEDELNEMSSQIEDDLQAETNIFPGQLCVSKYGDQPTYYRATVVKVNIREQVCSLAFLDYGNTEHNIPFSDIKVLHPKFCNLPAQAVSCCLVGEAVRQTNFDEIVERDDLKMKVLKILGSGIHVIEFSEDKPASNEKVTNVREKPVTNHMPAANIEANSPYQPAVIDTSNMHDLCISHIDKNGTFYSQQLANSAKIDALMCELQSIQHVPINHVAEGTVCIVKSAKDGVFYRAQVIKESEQQVLVSLVDFGDKEHATKLNLYALPASLRQVPEQCFMCHLANTSGNAVVTELAKYEGSRPLVGRILRKLGDLYDVELYDTSSAEDVRISDLLSHHTPSSDLTAPTKAKVSIPSNNIADGSEEKLFVTAVLSNNIFFGQLTKYDADALDKFQKDLTDHYTAHGGRRLSNPAAGDVCCTTFSDDGLYYRARILELQGNESKIFFVDYGNTETKPLEDLRLLASEFCQIPEQGITCILSAEYSGVTKTDLEAAVLEQEIQVTIVRKTACYEVYLAGNDPLQRFRKQINLPGVATPGIRRSAVMEFQKQTVPVGRWEEVLVSHIEDPEHLYCQRIVTQSDLNTLLEEIELYATSCESRVHSVTDGQPVIAKDASEGWYRAQVVVTKSSTEVEVNFVDFGNSETVLFTNLRPMKADYMKLPCQALHSYLVGIQCTEDGIWAPEETDQLWKTVDVTKLVFNVHDFEPTEDHYAIELFDQRKSLNLLFGKGIGKLSRDFMSAGPPPDQLPPMGATQTPNEQFSANTWAKGFEESNKKTQAPTPPESLNNGWREGSAGHTQNADTGFDRPNPRTFGAGSSFGQKSTSEPESGFKKSEFKTRDQGFDDQNRGFGGQTRPVDHGHGNSDESRGVGNQNKRTFGSHSQDQTVSSKTSYDRSGPEEKSFGGRSRDGGGFGGDRPNFGSNERSSGFDRKSDRGSSSFGDRGQNRPDSGGSRYNRDSNAVKSFGGSKDMQSEALPMITTAKLNLIENEYMDVFVSFASDPSHFWCQLAKNVDDLDKMMEGLGTEYCTLGPNDLVSTHLSNSQLCCAKYSVDDGWYRAKVTNISGDTVSVIFIDYGNDEKVSKSSVKLLKENYLKLPFQAFQCKLSGVESVDPQWSAVAIDKFQELTLDKSLVACIVQKKGESCTVELIDHSSQIGEELVKAGLARSLDVPLEMPGKRSQRRLSSASTSSRTSTSSKGSCSDKSAKEIKEIQLSKNKVVDVNVSYVDTPGNFWCQLTQGSDELQHLMAQIKRKYEALCDDDLIITAPECGQVCCAKFTEDDEWYRASVAEMKPGKVKVKFVDYGNEEWLTNDRIRELDSSLMEVEAQAIKCCLFGIKPVASVNWSGEAAEKFEEVTAEKNLVAKVISKKADTFQVRLVDIKGQDEISIGDELVKLSLAECDANLVKTFKQPDVKIGNSYTAVISWTVGPRNFYCQLENNKMALERLSSDLYEFYQKLKLNDMAICDPHIGQACVSYYAPDGNWYRSLIHKLRANEALVVYIDYGNKAKVPLSKVKEVTSTFIDLPLQAIPCQLHGLQFPEDKWPSAAIDAFKKSLSDVVSCKFLSKENNLYSVELKDSQDISVAENVNSICRGDGPIRKKTAVISSRSGGNDDSWGGEDGPEPVSVVAPKSMSPPKPKVAPSKPESVSQTFKARTLPSTQVTVYVANVTSPTKFQVQLAEESEDLEQWAEVVHGKMEASTGTLGTAHVGSVCGSKFSEDGCWYRAEVTEVSGDTVSVLFVDYGNTDKTTMGSLKTLSSELLDKVPFCMECSLMGVKPPKDGWSSEQIQTFKDKTDDKELGATFTQKGSHFEATLLDGDVDLSQDFKCEPAAEVSGLDYPAAQISVGESQVFLSHVVSPAEFYVNIVDQSADLDTLMATMAEIEGNESLENLCPGMACAAIFADDGCWYRASIVGQCDGKYQVFYVDYGNSGSVEATQITALPTGLVDVPPFAIKCGLDGVSECTSADAVTKLTALGGESEQELTAVFLSKTQPCSVQLSNGDLNINNEIRTLTPPQAPKVDSASDNTTDTRPSEVLYTQETGASITAPAPEENFPTSCLPLGKIQAYVSHMESPTELYLQLAKQSVEIEQLVDRVDTKYGCMNDMENCVSEATVGQLCCAKMTSNGVWYRGKVIENSTEGYTVKFVDYGNTDLVPISSIKNLTEEFKLIPEHSFQCCLAGAAGSTSWSDELIDQLFTQTTDKILSVEVLSEKSPYDVIINDKDECVNTVILGELFRNYQEKKETGTPEADEQVVLPDYHCELGRSQVFVSAVESPTEFYIQKADSNETLKTLAASLVSHYEGSASNVPVASPMIGQTCVTRYAVDGSWCRTDVRDIQDEGVSVFFLDYGNVDVVEKSDLFELEPQFAAQARYAGKCALTKLPSTEVWSDEAIETFLNRVQEVELTINVLEKTDMLCVELFEGDVNIALELFSDKIIDAVSPPADSTVPPEAEIGEKGPSTEVDPKDEKQHEKDATEKETKLFSSELNVSREDLTKEVTDNPDEATKSETAPGAIESEECSEESPLIEESQVPEENIAEGNVLNTDQSEETTSEQCQVEDEEENFQDASEELPESVPPTSGVISTQEHDTSQDPIMSEEAERIDREFPEQVLTDGKEGLVVGDKLEIYVTEIVSPSKFWCQRASSESALKKLQDDMKTYYEDSDESNPTILNKRPGSICAAFFGDIWYRARVSKYPSPIDTTVQISLVDYGSTCSVPSDQLYVLQDQFMDLTIQSIECVLSDIQAIDGHWSQAAVARFREIITDKKLLMEIVMMPSFGDSEEDPIIVVCLFDMGLSVSKMLLDEQLCTDSSNALYPSRYSPLPPVAIDEAPQSPSPQYLPQSPVHTTAASRQLNHSFAETPKKSQAPAQPKYMSLEVDTRVEVYISHIESVDEFYVQLKTCQEELSKLLSEMGDYCENNNDTVETISADQIVVAKSEDGYWYRASVCRVDGEEVTVHFVDYGNSETINVKLVQSVMSSFRELPFQAVCCSLDGVSPTGDHWEADTINTFSSLATDKCLLAEVKSQLEDSVYLVHLLDMGISLSTSLVEKSLAISSRAEIKSTSSDDPIDVADTPHEKTDVSTPQEPTPSDIQHIPVHDSYKSVDLSDGSVFDVFVSHAESPVDIWCQLPETSHEDLPLLQDRIQDYCTNLAPEESVLDQLRPGTPCMAVYSGVWYRAQVMTIKHSDTVEVCFVDYGNSEDVLSSSLKEVPSEMLTLPKQAFHCKLSGIQSMTEDGSWDEASCNRLTELVMYEEEKYFKLHVQNFVPDQSLLVCVECKLQDGNVDIAEELVKEGYAQKLVPSEDDVPSGQNMQEDPEVKSQISVMVEKIIKDARAEVEAGLYCADPGPTTTNQAVEAVPLVQSPLEPEPAPEDNDLTPYDELPSAEPVSEPELQRKESDADCYEFGPDDSDDMVTNCIEYEEDGPINEMESSFLEMSIHRENSVGSIAEHEALDISDTQAYSQLKYSENSVLEMYVLEARDPDNIVLQPCDTADKLQTVMTKLQELCSDFPALEDLQPSQRCCAESTKDGRWYRAQVVGQAEDGIVEVYYVDYGNAEKLPWERLRLLDQDVLDLPAQAIKCTLEGIRPASTAWSPEAGELIESLCGSQSGKMFPVSVKVTKVDEDIRLTGTLTTKNGEDVATELMTKKLGQSSDAESEPESDVKEVTDLDSDVDERLDSPQCDDTQEDVGDSQEVFSDTREVVDEPQKVVNDTQEVVDDSQQDVCDTQEEENEDAPEEALSTLSLETEEDNDQMAESLSIRTLKVDEKHDAFVSHVVSPSQFWCQFEGEALGDMMATLEDYYLADIELKEEGHEWTEGDLCSARSSEDMWYRAQIQSCYGELATVRFVDYGNEETTEIKNLRPLSQRFAKCPNFAVECNLHGVTMSGGDWDDRAADLMKEEMGQPLCLTVLDVPESGPVLVSLMSRSGTNVADTLVSQRVARRRSVSEDKN